MENSNPTLDMMNQASQGSQPQSNTMDTQLPSNPPDLSKAMGYVDNPDMNQHQGMCQEFVEQMTLGHAGVYPSAIDAWSQQQDKAVQGTQGLKPGDVLYFSPNQSNEGYGHTGIYEGNNKFVSATDNGVKPYDLSEWESLTGQQVLGFIPQESINNPILDMMKGVQ